jgi:hypothetical protein
LTEGTPEVLRCVHAIALGAPVVVVIAHSNAQGIRVANDLFATWDAFAGSLPAPPTPARRVQGGTMGRG